MTAPISATFHIWRLFNFIVSLSELRFRQSLSSPCLRARGPRRARFWLAGVVASVVGFLLFRSGLTVGGSESFAAQIHLIIWIADVEPDGRCLARGRRVSRAARSRERKVRTPQSSVPDNVRECGFKAT